VSSDAVSWAFDVPDLSKSEVLVAVAIAEWANPSGVAFPGQESIAKRCKCGADTVVKLMMTLERKGVIGRAERRREDNGRRTSDWVVLGPHRTAEQRRPMKPAPDQEHYPAVVLALFEPARADNSSHGKTPSDAETTSLRVSTPDHFGFSPDFTSGSDVPLREEENHQKEPPERTTPRTPPQGGAGQTGLDAEWTSLVERLLRVVDENTFKLWLADLRPVSNGNEFVIEAPAQVARWISGRFGAVLSDAAAKPVRLVLPDGSPVPERSTAAPRERRRRRRAA
jgi:hypothetical protein